MKRPGPGTMLHVSTALGRQLLRKLGRLHNQHMTALDPDDKA